ncbi:hypothetical protein [Streptomyces sp. TLI_185]|uniref:hypothetical protein n=1 Tax=Streptomyces sp. TLI_185 TaxID=2485151 RepID=UPI000F512227|nr:hypothetical protein [Streptomyces sp. TLI_185]
MRRPVQRHRTRLIGLVAAIPLAAAGSVSAATAPAEAASAAIVAFVRVDASAFTLDWWDLHNGTDCSRVTTVEGATDYDDGGILSSGASCEPPLNTPFPPYYGARMITKLGAPGDRLVRAASSTSLVSAHAVRRANGDVSVRLINKDPANAATVTLSYSGFTPSSATPTVYSYLKNATSIASSTTGSATRQTVPAYSIVVVQLRRNG